MTGSDVCLSVAEHLLAGVRLSRELFPSGVMTRQIQNFGCFTSLGPLVTMMRTPKLIHYEHEV